MPYDDRSFFNGLAFGLAATAGRPMGPFLKNWATGMKNLLRYPSGDFDTFVSKMWLQTAYPLTIVYEYGPDRNAPERVFRRVPASHYVQTLCHVVQLPSTVKSTAYHYNVHFFERQDMIPGIHFWAGFMLFPYYTSSQSWLYPGSPELVDAWYTQSNRGGYLLDFGEGEVDAGI